MTTPDPAERAGSAAIPDLATLLDQMTGRAPEPPPTPAVDKPPDDGAPTAPMFSDVDSFMRHYLAPVVERRVTQGAANGVNWCPWWWKHPEAISRLYALWRAWETLRVADPDTGMSIWWRDHFDNHFAVLTGEYGPFSKCAPDRGHVDTTPLPVEPAPAEVLAQLPDFEVRGRG
ncbi:DUF4913 domain-containing protein [Actinoplanes subglobosus]|uniref:DUF4913 domain-containing protein n=1 Tax=Actinoplanes subglobosus TaxID=1547892 RepID=A0ABV8IRC4_9ACTN